MKIEGQHLFAASPELVWSAVTDPSVLAKVLPGCEDFHAIAGSDPQHQEFEGKLKIKVGPVQGEFQGNVLLSDLQPPHSYHLKIKGKGAPGFVEGDGALELVAQDGGTLLKYTVDAKIGGRIATVGQRLLDSSSKVITRQALEGLEQQVLARIASHEAGAAVAAAEAAEAEAAAHAAEQQEAETSAAAQEAAMAAAKARAEAEAKAAAAEAAAAKAAQAPSQSEFAATFAKEMAREMIPKPLRPVLAAIILAIALGAVVLLVRGC